ncbi:MAG: hypothetical protein RLP02_00105 [Coleofasciculus sp. C2-GNP5-27]
MYPNAELNYSVGLIAKLNGCIFEASGVFEVEFQGYTTRAMQELVQHDTIDRDYCN